MNTTKLILVRYNDCYGHSEKTYETIVKSKADFKRWLKQHNEKRKEIGGMKESAEEFDLIEIDLFQ